MNSRSISPFINEFLGEKLILLTGPRQVGKTYLSQHIQNDFQYYNFDSLESRKEMLEKTWVRDQSLVIFDEIHKMNKWKQWLKGIYDLEKGKNKILVTGSSKMETFRKTGDSLAGRHYSVRLLPFSLKELGTSTPKKTFYEMLKLGSFPEPFLSQSDRKAALWRKSHLDAILRQDVIDQETIKNVSSIETLVELLSHRVGRGISYKNLSDELSVSPQTVKRWIQLLENYYIIFTVYPYTKNVAEAVKKEPRIFFYDVGRVKSDEGFKIENLAALHLLKRNWFLEDTEGAKTRLCYLRDKKKHDVDFAVEFNGKLTHLIEIKKSDDSYNSSLNYFSERLKPERSLHLVLELNKKKDFKNYQVRDLSQFLFTLET
ncbi:MAG: ATP-binding protein [Pseudobdellovibrionaceae bacterium]